MDPIRRLALSGNFTDTDWTDPAINPPDNARRFKILSSDVQFELIGKASGAKHADLADLGALEVDAWIGYEGGSYGEPPVISITRGLSLSEATGSALSGRIRFVASDANVGATARLHLVLTNVTVPAIEVRIVSGAIPL